MTILYSKLANHIKWAVSLLIADGHLIFLRSLCEYVLVTVLTLSPLEETDKQ